MALKYIGAVGFGCDSRTNDYKVVIIKLPGDLMEDSPYGAELYTLSTNSWKEIDLGGKIFIRLYSAMEFFIGISRMVWACRSLLLKLIMRHFMAYWCPKLSGSFPFPGSGRIFTIGCRSQFGTIGLFCLSMSKRVH